MNYYLGIDSGGTFIKAGLYDATGKQIAICRQSADVINQQQGWVERNLESLWQDTQLVIQGVLKKALISPADIKGVSISAQGKGLYLLDKQGRDLRNGILSSDSRSMDIVRQWQKQHIPEHIYPITRQTLWTGHPVSILRWLKDNEPQCYQNIGTVFMSHDYLRYRLTGQIAAEITNISESNFFNAQNSQYDIELLKLFGIEEIFDALPPIIYPTTHSGSLTQEAANQTGLLKGTPVYGGLFDVVSTAICSGINSTEAELNVVMGTWAVTSGITSLLKQSPQYNYVYGHHAIPGEYIIHEASPTSAGNYEWFAPYLGQDGILQHEMNETLVSQLKPLNNPIIFVPFLYGSNAGLGLKAGLYGLQSHHTKADLIQAIWQGILFCHYSHIEKMRRRFPQAHKICVTGGPTHCQTWMQMLADLTGMPVEIQLVEETGTLGAVIVAMVGAGEYASIPSAINHLNMQHQQITPDPDLFHAYQHKYQQYIRFIELLKSYEGIAQ